MTQDESLITISYIENIPGNYRVYSCSIRVPKSHWEFSRGLYIHCWFTICVFLLFMNIIILCISFLGNWEIKNTLCVWVFPACLWLCISTRFQWSCMLYQFFSCNIEKLNQTVEQCLNYEVMFLKRLLIHSLTWRNDPIWQGYFAILSINKEL